MRSTDERLDVIKRRTKELNDEKKMRNGRILSLSSFAACLLLVVGAAFAMPGVMEGFGKNGYVGVGGFASIFSSGNSVGYVFIALLAFSLGVCVTFLCIQLQRRNKEGKSSGRSN